MGIPPTKEHILTSSIASAKYIKKNINNPTLFMISEIGLQQALKDEEIKITNENVTHVVMGIDKQINYQKLASAADFVRKGATFISTNKDLSLPSEDGRSEEHTSELQSRGHLV